MKNKIDQPNKYIRPNSHPPMNNPLLQGCRKLNALKINAIMAAIITPMKYFPLSINKYNTTLEISENTESLTQNNQQVVCGNKFIIFP